MLMRNLRVLEVRIGTALRQLTLSKEIWTKVFV